MLVTIVLDLLISIIHLNVSNRPENKRPSQKLADNTGLSSFPKDRMKKTQIFLVTECQVEASESLIHPKIQPINKFSVRILIRV